MKFTITLLLGILALLAFSFDALVLAADLPIPKRPHQLCLKTGREPSRGQTLQAGPDVPEWNAVGISEVNDPDAQFFAQHPDRYARIREPGREPFKDMQRAVRYLSECELEFRSLGDHDQHRRRIIAYRTASTHPTNPNTIIKIPFLLFADESVEDTDQVLLPIVHRLMMEAAKR